MRGEARKALARGKRGGENGAGWRGTAGAELGGGSSSCLAQRQLEEGIGMDWTEASMPAQCEERRRGAIADAWRRRRRAQSPVWPASFTVKALEHSDRI